MTKESDCISVFAPATVANVACGFDVLGFALEHPGDEITVKKTDTKKIVISKIEGAEDLPLDPEKNVVGVAIKALLQELGSDQGLEISIKKGVKPGSGIGSSAASSAGAVVAVNRLLKADFSDTDLVRFAMEGERLASGTAHADNVAPGICGGFTLVRSYAPLDVIKLNTPNELYCTVIHPQIEVKTSDARSVLRISLPLKKAVEQWGNVGGLVAGLFLEDYALIGRSLQDVIVEPIRSVLIPGFDKVKASSLAAGALGCSISGSGPSIFALSKGLETAEKVKIAMSEVYESYGIDYIVYVSKVNPEGVKTI
jgi:homoserine kinase